ncbi:MAG: TetR-like C-terminal domain-containing protein, partial [Solirubrobacteraceae bacterium]
SPVPGYRAPEATIGPAGRVPLAFAGVIGDALASGELASPPEALPGTGTLFEQAAVLSATLAGPAGPAESPGSAAVVPPDALVRAMIAWTQLYGMISFELFGQFVGSFEPADALFAYTVAQLTAFVGLR